MLVVFPISSYTIVEQVPEEDVMSLQKSDYSSSLSSLTPLSSDIEEGDDYVASGGE